MISNCKLKPAISSNFFLRIGEKLYDALASWAEDDFRSLNGQIEYLLTECVKQRKKDGKYVGESIDEPIELDID